MVRDLDIADGALSLTIALTVPGCPLRAELPAAGRPRAARVSRHRARRALVRRHVARARRPRSPTKLRGGVTERSQGISVDAKTRVLAVASGKGGVGKSSLTVNLAAAFSVAGAAHGRARRRRLRLLDPGHARHPPAPDRGRQDDRPAGPRRPEGHVDRLLPRRQRAGHVARPDAPPRARAVPLRRPLGRARLARRRHAARHRATSRSRSASSCPRRRSSS